MHGGTPVFAVEDGPPPPASPKFTCQLTIPAVHTPHGGFEETRFTAWARSKKAAEHSAAGALSFLNQNVETYLAACTPSAVRDALTGW